MYTMAGEIIYIRSLVLYRDKSEGQRRISGKRRDSLKIPAVLKHVSLPKYNASFVSK
jgi:hypothetical protein